MPNQLLTFLKCSLSRRALELLIGPTILFFLWWFAYANELVDKNLLPSPVTTLLDTFFAIFRSDMVHDFNQTLIRVGYSIAIATVFGVPIGIALGAKDRVYRSLEFLIDFLRFFGS